MTSTCTCDPKGLPDVSDASCPLHGIVAFLESGAAIEPDDSSVSIAPPCECADGGHDTGDGTCMCGGALDLVERAHPRQGAFVTEAEFARFLASWWIHLGSESYRCEWSNVVRRGRFKDGC